MLTQVSDPIIVGENAHFLATNDEFVWTVIVTPEALQALTRDQTVPITSVLLYADVLTRIADENLSKLDAILDERVWVMKADVERWLGSQKTRWKARRARDKAAKAVFEQTSRPATVPVH